MDLRIRLTSAKVGVEVEAELGNFVGFTKMANIFILGALEAEK